MAIQPPPKKPKKIYRVTRIVEEIYEVQAYDKPGAIDELLINGGIAHSIKIKSERADFINYIQTKAEETQPKEKRK